MKRRWLSMAAACGLLALMASRSMAGPPGHGLRRAPQALSSPARLPVVAGAAAPRGVSRAASDTARMTRGLSRASSSLSRVPSTSRSLPPGVPPQRRPFSKAVNPSATRPGQGSDAVRTAAQKTLELRLRQADHLTEVADQNGNERLAEAADRMRVQAQQQFEAAIERLDGVPPQSDDRRPSDTESSSARLPAPGLSSAKPSWRDRIHFASPFSR